MAPRLKLLTEPAPGDAESCYVDSALGVIAILRAVAASGSRAAAYLDGGTIFLHTTLLAVEERPMTFLFEQGPDRTVNARALEANTLAIVTSDRGVPVQFSCPRPEPAEFEGAPAFRAALPERVLRLQRREYYRLDGSPVHGLLRCTLMRGDDDTHALLRPAVMDVSCGGLALALPGTQAILPEGSRHACTLEIPVLGGIEVTVEVHTSRKVTLPSGAAAMRYGVRFLNIEVKYTALLQRYIVDQERVRKTRR